MMNRFTSLFLVLFVVILGGLNEVKAQVAPAPAQKLIFQDTTKALLWEITGKELSSPSWLYGTIHMIGANDFFLTSATEEVFDKSERVTFEINMDDMFSLTALMSMMSNAMMDNGTSLKDLVSEEDYELVKKHFDEQGMPLFLFEKVKPLFLSALTADTEGGNLQDGSVKSYEMEFMNMAKTGKKEMAGLETIEFQMGIFDSIPYKDQAQMLVDGIKGTDAGDSEFEDMVALYKDQDIQGMLSMFDEESGIANYEDVLLTTRNKNWIPIMEKMMAEKTTFFAVGAGHLGGKNGVLQLLYEAGYSLKPLTH